MKYALSQLLRPLARLAIARQVPFGFVANCLKRAFLDAAQSEAGEKAPVSKLSVLTGLQRRDVTTMLETPDADAARRPDPLSKIVALWRAEYDGMVLPHHGDAPSFDALARTVRKDVHPRSFLDALVAAGTVSVGNGTVRLMMSAHVPLAGSEEQIRYLGDNVGDHLAVAVENVLGDAPQFDLAVHYDGLSPGAAQELEALWRARMDPVLREVNARAAALQDTDPGHVRIRGGGYFRVKDEPCD